MFFIGDVHGKWDEYFNLISKMDQSIQVGDFGFGFKKDPSAWDINHRFMRGNHDSPLACRAHPNYLGDYGVTKDNIFFVSGAHSIDYKWRMSVQHLYPNPIWWEDEEIAETEFKKILKLYKSTKPEIVVTHDCPSKIRNIIIKGGSPHHNRTSDNLLSSMFEIHSPALWVFGHYHISFKAMLDETLFICLNELEVLEQKSIGT